MLQKQRGMHVAEKDARQGRKWSDSEMVSPYLLRPCRSYEEYLRDRREAELAEQADREAAQRYTVVAD